MENPNFDEILVITWSASQDTFHVETIKAMLFGNWRRLYRVNPNASDWIVVGFAKTPDEAHSSIEQMKKNMDNPRYGTDFLT